MLHMALNSASGVKLDECTLVRTSPVPRKLFSELRQVFGGDMERAPTGEDLRFLALPTDEV